MNSVGQLTLSLDIVTNQAMSALKNLENQMKNIGKSAEGIGAELNNNIKNLKVDDIKTKAKTEIDKDTLNQSLNDAYSLIQSYFGARTIKAMVKVAADAAEVNYRALDGKITAGMNDKEFKDVKANLKLTSHNTTVDYSELIDATNDALSNDISKEEINSFMDIGANLSVANFSDVGSATGALASIKNSLGLNKNEMAGVADMLTKANKDLGRIDLSALNDGLKQNSSLLASGKVSLAEYLAAAEVMTSQGAGQAETQTFIGAYMNTVMQASAETKKWAKENYNLDFSMKHLKKVGLGNFQKEIMEKTGGNEDAIAKLFGNLRGEKAFEALTKGADKYDTALNKLANSQGYLNKVMDELKNDPYFQYQQSVNDFHIALQNLGEALLPVLTMTTKVFTFLANAIAAIPEPVMQVIAGIIILVSAFVIVNGIMKVTQGIINGPLIAALKSMKTGFLEGGASLLKFGLKGLLIIAAVAAIVYAIWFLYKNWSFVWSGLKGVIQYAAAGILKIIQGIVWAFETAVNAASNALSSMLDKFNLVKRAQSAIEAGKNISAGMNTDDKKKKDENLKKALKNGLYATTGINLNKENKKASHTISNSIGDLSSEIAGYGDKNFKDAAKKFKNVDWNPFDDLMAVFNKNKDKVSNLSDTDYNIADKLVNANTKDIGDVASGVDDVAKKINKGKSGSGSSSKTKNNVDNLTDSVDDNKKSWDDLKSSLEQVADSFDDVAAKFEKMAYKVVNSTDILKNAQYNLQITTQFKDVRDKLLNNSNINGYALNYIAGLDASNLGELKALLGLSNNDLSAWNSAMNSMNAINTVEAGKTTIIQNNYEINRVANEQEIVNYIHAAGKKQGWAK